MKAIKNAAIFMTIALTVIATAKHNTNNYLERVDVMRSTVETCIERDVENFNMTNNTQELVKKYNKMVDTARKIWWIDESAKVELIHIDYNIDTFTR